MFILGVFNTPLRYNLTNLHNVNIIADLDDLNDMLHMLIDRFVYIIKLIGPDLPETFYIDLKKQIDQNNTWLKLDEIEDLIDTKIQKLNNAIFNGRIKATAAHNFGIL